MARYTAGTTSSGAGTAARPIGGLMAVASRSCFVREVGCFNTTTTAFPLRLAKITAAGTPGTGLTEEKYHGTDDTPDMTAFDTWSADATISAGNIRIARIGAAIGAGVIWTFAEPGVYIPAGTANGIGLVGAGGAGQICDWYIEWEE
jgi:hypothetical protein